MFAFVHQSFQVSFVDFVRTETLTSLAEGQYNHGVILELIAVIVCIWEELCTVNLL